MYEFVFSVLQIVAINYCSCYFHIFSLIFIRYKAPFSSSSSLGPMVNATDVPQPKRLIVLTLFPPCVWTFPRSPTDAPAMQEIPVAKGGTMLERINH